MNKKDVIKRIKNIMPKYNPKQAFIFGSYAYGKPNIESDLDLLMITDEDNKIYYQKVMKDLYHFEVPVELIVLNSKTFEERLTCNTMFQEIKQKGIKIYGN